MLDHLTLFPDVVPMPFASDPAVLSVIEYARICIYFVSYSA